MKKNKVLHIINWLNYGGAERFLLNLLENINKENLEFDIMVRNYPNPMSSQFNNLKVNIIEAPKFPTQILKHKTFIKNFIKNKGHEYEAVHIHSNSLIYVWPILYFKKYHPQVKLIVHSHSSGSTNRLVEMIHIRNRRNLVKSIDFKIGCSTLAGKWMFDQETFKVIYNGINIDDFIFNSYSREKLRNKNNLKDNIIVLGAIGRLTPVKNFQFLVELMKNLEECKPGKYNLMIIGEGELKEELIHLADIKGVADKILFMGQRDDIPDLLSAIDIYLQPSLFEGFPFTVIEAQVSNLPVLISNNISKEVKISSRLSFIGINNMSNWMNKILKTGKNLNRTIYSEVDTETIDISNISTKFEKIYLK